MRDRPQLLVSDREGKIFNVPFLEACGMKAGHFFRLTPEELRPLPPCSQLMMLPDRRAAAFDPETGDFVHLKIDPFSDSRRPCFPVAAFLTPGYAATYNAAYIASQTKKILPLFAYAAVVFYRGGFYAACVRVDRERRQDPRYMDMDLMRKNIRKFKKMFPKNRLVAHLENCACVNGCPAARNFFLKRYEAPLPTSPSCNARCAGCISYQPSGRCPVTQPRIRFVPSSEEIAEVALFHMQNVKDPVVSFGQGCEGEPLMVADTIEKAIVLIRKRTRKGVINLNTNASKPKAVARLCDAGLDSIRVSLNSVQQEFYDRYYSPGGYTLGDVRRAVRQARKRGVWVSLNYLIMPGLTDSVREYALFEKFVEQYDVNMIQWRNMNFDPAAYFRILKYSPEAGSLIGMGHVINGFHARFPRVMKGYFNPTKNRMRSGLA